MRFSPRRSLARLVDCVLPPDLRPRYTCPLRRFAYQAQPDFALGVVLFDLFHRFARRVDHLAQPTDQFRVAQSGDGAGISVAGGAVQLIERIQKSRKP